MRINLTRWITYALCLAACALALTVVVAWQTPQPIPPFEGDGNPQHDGQPKFCQNVDSKTHARNCDCKPHMGDKECQEPDRGAENPKCSVWCRKPACRCERDCGKTE